MKGTALSAVDLPATDLLVDAQLRIEDIDYWTTGARARDYQGMSTEPEDESAVCWCAIGTLQATTTEYGYSEQVYREALDILNEVAYNITSGEEVYDSVETLNDRAGHTAVMELYDQAIEVSTL